MDVEQDLLDDEARGALDTALKKLQGARPNERSEKSRYYAIVITDVEKALALFDGKIWNPQ